MPPILLPTLLLILLPFSTQQTLDLRPPPFPSSPSGPSQLVFPSTGPIPPHPLVLRAHAEEAQLPAQLTAPHYRNPALRSQLAQHSWLGPGETPVGRTEAENIPRREIYTVLSHAGLIQRNRL